CASFTNDSFVFVNKLLDEVGVDITPGLDFGEYNASHHVRFAYTRSIPVLEEAVSRLKEYLKNF
ncbi:MAG: aminotransferase, partial [Gammaproteobacteria bacterium]|nr:aminotransferase [Gammaproteobacteria bacterium]